MRLKKIIIPIGITCLLIGLIAYKFIFLNKTEKGIEGGTQLDVREKQREVNDQQPDKEKVHAKMLDSIDFFKNCQGEYEEYREGTGEKSNIKYSIDVENQRGISSISSNDLKERTVIYLENKKYNFDDNNNTYREFEWIPRPKDEKRGKLSVKERVSGKSGDLYRSDAEFLGYSSQSLLTEWSALLVKYNDWEFEESKFLNLDCYKLTGIIDKTLSESLQGKFEMIIEKNTGILLDFKSYDENDKVKYYLITKQINIDKGIDENVFKKDNSNYQKIDKVNTNK